MIVRKRKVNEMSQKLVIDKEIVKVKGRVKTITIKKEEFDKFLKLVKLRILDKEYEALMPPLDHMQKNTIDVNGLMVMISQYISALTTNSGNSGGITPAQMVLTTQSGTVTLTYTGSVNSNTQGVSVYLQVFEDNGSFVWQYYYVGYDTTNASYTASQIELYASAYIYTGCFPGTSVGGAYYTNIVRIAYTNVSFTKSADSYLFIVWLIQFQNIPPYAILFVPVLQSNANITLYIACNSSTSYKIYVNNNNCNVTCGGNCPSGGLTGFLTYVKGDSVILEVPVMVAIGQGVSPAEILICSTAQYVYSNVGGNPTAFTTSSQLNTTLSPPVSGGTFYLALATITLTFETS